MKKPSETQVGGAHYKDMPIQPHYFCHTNKLGALESNIVKYVCRHSRKGGKADLLKARHYIDLLLEWQYDDDGQTAPPDTVAGMTTMHPLSVREILDAKNLEEVRRMASAGGPLITPLPPGWPYAQNGALDADEVGELTEPASAPCAHHCGFVDGYCIDCNSQILCRKHGLTVCKVCEFPAGTSYGGTTSD